MKLPVRAPKLFDSLGLLQSNPVLIFEIGKKVSEPTVSGEYVHWDRLRFLKPPEGLTLDEWWLAIKLKRMGGRTIDLADTSGASFSFNLVDPLPEYLHEIDLLAGGLIRMPEQVMNPETRSSYIVRSLIEEAFSSSQMEGAVSTRKIAKELIREERKPQVRGEQMILNNFRTMERILDLKGENLSPALVLEIHRMVTEDALDDPTGAGRLRRDDEYQVVGDDYGVVFHEPPPAGELAARMEALCDFANAKGADKFIHPAIRSMILHFWLAYDHPFIDGNGRTARALFYWSMLKHGYWLFEFISISHAIIKSPIAYGKAFLYTETDENDLTYFLVYMTKIVRRSIRELNEFISRRSVEIKALESGLRGMISLNYRQRALVGHAIRHPGTRYTVESHRVSHHVSRQTANNDLSDLEQRGLLLRQAAGRAHTFIASPQLEERLAEAQ